MATLYIVATPIGNLKDITLRALEVLKEVDVIACEDTRHTLKLLNHYEIKKHLISLNAINEREAFDKVTSVLQKGENVAYVSDAGTPCISDPGSVLVSEVRKAGFDVVPVPGVSAFVTLLSVAGIFGKSFHFEGFLSPKQGKRKRKLQELIELGEPFLVYESPYRMVRLLSDIVEVDENCRLVIGKELTKLHERIMEGSVRELLEVFGKLGAVKGEFVILILPKT